MRKLNPPITLYQVCTKTFDRATGVCAAKGKYALRKQVVTYILGNHTLYGPQEDPVRAKIAVDNVAHLRDETTCRSPHTSSMWGRTPKEAVNLYKRGIAASCKARVESNKKHLAEDIKYHTGQISDARKQAREQMAEFKKVEKKLAASKG